MSPVPDRFQSLHAVDYAAIAAYFAVVIWVGFYYGRRQKSTEDYFLAGRSLSWFSVGVSIVATVLSTVTYLSTPGEMIKNGVGANAQFLSYPLVFFLVSYLILPYLMRLRVTTAYEYLERRFDLTTRLFGASLFVLIRTAWMGMVLFTASLALSKICSLSFTTVVVGLVAIGVFYTVLGGLRAVIWTDVVQFFILLGGAIFTVVYVAVDSGTGPATWWNDMMAADTPSQPVFSFDPTVRLSLVGMGCWTLFWWLATASSDQVAVQRFLATESLQASRRAFLCNLVSGVVLIADSFPLRHRPLLLLPGRHPRRPRSGLPPLHPPHPSPGLAGLVVAALFSAAMSSLDSGMNSISSVVVTDFYRRFRSAVPTPRQELFLARAVTAAVGGLATVICLLLYQIPEEQRGNLFDIQGRVTSFLVGSLGGLMLIAMLGIRCSARVAMGSALCGILVGFLWAQGHWLFGLPELAWMWVIPVSTLVTVGAAALVSMVFGEESGKLS